MNRKSGIDLIKILATCIILFHHYQQSSGARFRYFNFYQGHIKFAYTVELFFVISGYLSCHYIYSILDGMTFKEYVQRRYLRLLPIMAISTIFTAFLNLFIMNHFDSKVYAVIYLRCFLFQLESIHSFLLL